MARARLLPVRDDHGLRSRHRHPERRLRRRLRPTCDRHRRARAGDDLPLPACRRKLRGSGVRRRSDPCHRFQNRAADRRRKTTTASTPAAASTPRAVPAPELLRVRQSATKWRQGNGAARISRSKTPTGTTFSFSLNEPATVTFSFTQRVGRRTATAGTLTFAGHSDTNRVAFQGRISRREEAQAGALHAGDHGDQPRRTAICTEVAELHDREITPSDV